MDKHYRCAGSALFVIERGTVYLWESDTGQELHRLEAHQRGGITAAFPDGARTLVTAGHDHTVCTWDIRTGNRLKQVVVNLLDNAIRYTSEGGSIFVSAGRRNGSAVLTVADNGAGIPPEALPHVFERFYRADKARSRYSGGAGLGLSIVNAICAAHRGDIEVSSREGVGTTMTVLLPLVEN